MKSKLFYTLSLLIGLMYGCSELGNNDEFETKGIGSVVISLTDAPFPMDSVAEANVVIDWVKLKKAETETSEEDSDSNFVELAVSDTFNLLELINGEKTILGVLDSIPVGEYGEIRMRVTEATLMLNDSSTYDLKIPSGGTSGLKIKIKPALVVEEGDESEILLDFDASRSFKVKGNIKNIKGFMFSPVIRAVNLSKTGEIVGAVTEAVTEGVGTGIKNAHLYLTFDTGSEIDTVASAKTSKEGLYRIIGIPEGDYSLSCVKEEYESNPESVAVSIVTGDVKEQNFTLTKVSDD